MYKVLIHAGLPKTATTTLQVNVLMPLHKMKKINFLGRFLESKNSLYFNPISSIIGKLKSKELNGCELSSLRNDLEKMMDEKKLNVISEEVLILTHDCKHELLWKNLKNLMTPYDLKVCLSLRNPEDFIFSYYVELYRGYYQFKDDMNTFEKFIRCIQKDAHKKEFDILFYERIIQLFNNIDLNLFFFEDLKYDKRKYCSDFSRLLGLNSSAFYELFFQEKQNVRKKVKSGKYSQKTTLNQYVSRSISRLMILMPFLKFLKRVPLLKRLIKNLLIFFSKIPLGTSKKHSIPSGYSEFISQIFLTEGYQSFIKDLNLDSEKLKKYRYLKLENKHE